MPVGQFVNGELLRCRPGDYHLDHSTPDHIETVQERLGDESPTANGKSGFDSRLNDGTDESWWFDASLRKYPPITLNPGDSIVSSISLVTIHTLCQK